MEFIDRQSAVSKQGPLKKSYRERTMTEDDSNVLFMKKDLPCAVRKIAKFVSQELKIK